jgi:transcriptional regulator
VGKWKVSQNRDEADRAGVAAGLAADPGQAEMAHLVATGGTPPR